MYNKKNNYRKKNYKPRYGRYANKGVKRGQIYGAAVGQLWKDVSMLKGLVNTEFKFKDVAVTNLSIPSTGQVTDLNGLTKGDNVNQRSGRMVRWKSVQIQGQITRNPSSTTQDRGRICLVIDKHADGAGSGYTDIYDSLDVNSFRNLDNRKRYVILKSWNFVLDADKPERYFKVYKPIDMKTVYNSLNNGNIADIEANSLSLFYISDRATNQPTVDMKVRLRYIDN